MESMTEKDNFKETLSLIKDADNILYDLNRDEATTLTLGNEGLVRWVNDYAVAKVIRYLKENQK